MSYESYTEELVRRQMEAIEAQMITVERAQAQLDKMRAELKLLELQVEEERKGPYSEL